MSYIKNNKFFFGSILLGLIVWFLVFILLPVTVVENIKAETILFIIANYCALILGYISFKFNKSLTSFPSEDKLNSFLKALLIVIVVCYIIRWFDLIYIREMSFNLRFKENRVLGDMNYHKSNWFFIVASILKSAYFFPIVIVYAVKPKISKVYVIFSYLVLVLPLVEAVLKGTRKPFFEVFIILLFTILVFEWRKLNLKRIFLAIFGFVLLMIVTMSILIKRENKSDTDFVIYNELLESRYNDMLAPKQKVVNFIQDSNSSQILKFLTVTTLHTGQYLNHGIFEFNHIMNIKDLPITKGSYTFVAVPKFINKTSLFERINYSNPSPRKFVYLSFFGGLYIDFRWFAIVIMFLFGIFQKYVYQKSRKSVIWAPILIYFLIINVFLLVINYLRGAGIYPIISALLVLILFRVGPNLYEKSTNT